VDLCDLCGLGEVLILDMKIPWFAAIFQAHRDSNRVARSSYTMLPKNYCDGLKF